MLKTTIKELNDTLKEERYAQVGESPFLQDSDQVEQQPEVVPQTPSLLDTPKTSVSETETPPATPTLPETTRSVSPSIDQDMETSTEIASVSRSNNKSKRIAVAVVV